LREVKDYLIRIDNYFRKAKENQRNAYKKAASLSSTYKLFQRRLSPSSAPSVARGKDVYRLCERSDHWAKDCPRLISKKNKYAERRKELNIKAVNK